MAVKKPTLVTIHSKLVDCKFYIEMDETKSRPGIVPLFYLKEIETLEKAFEGLNDEDRAESLRMIIRSKIEFPESLIEDENGNVVSPKQYNITRRRTRRPSPKGGALAALQEKMAKDKGGT